MKKFYKLYLLINLWISENFFFSVAYFYKILHIKFFNTFKSLDSNFVPIQQQITMQEADVRTLEKKIFINKKYLKHFYLDKVPSFLIKIVESNKKKITRYLGKNFVYEIPSYYETYSLPEDIRHLDLYANVWHLDSDTYKVLKIFVLTGNVTEADGPLVYFDKTNTEKYWNELSSRGNKNAIKEYERQKKFIGKIGTYLILDTSRNLHRASSPSDKRSIISMSLYPSFVPRADVARYEWKF